MGRDAVRWALEDVRSLTLYPAELRAQSAERCDSKALREPQAAEVFDRRTLPRARSKRYDGASQREGAIMPIDDRERERVVMNLGPLRG
jgi:hypothetical protein